MAVNVLLIVWRNRKWERGSSDICLFTYSTRQKNVSKNVRYRFVRRYLPCGFVAVFDTRAVRF